MNLSDNTTVDATSVKPMNNVSSPEHVVLTILAGVLPLLLRNLLFVIPGMLSLYNKRKWLALLYDFMLIVIPVELAVTLLNDHLLYTTLVTIGSSVVIIIGSLLRRKSDTFEFSALLKIENNNKDNNIHASYFRGYINMFTVFAILAVDFGQLFPPGSHKSGIYGTSLMDTGVGYYIAINAAISSEARGTHIKGKLQYIRTSVSCVLPVVVCGLARVAVHNGLGVGGDRSYGRDWNFFFTIAVVRVVSVGVPCIVPNRLHIFLGPFVISFYQLLLSKTMLDDFLMSGYDGDNAGFFEANKTGILSCVGYIALYFTALELGKYYFRQGSTLRDTCRLAFFLLVQSFTWYILFIWSTNFIQPCSRSLGNITYLLFMMGLVTFILAIITMSNIVGTCVLYYTGIVKGIDHPDSHHCRLLKSVNYNALGFFIGGNLLIYPVTKIVGDPGTTPYYTALTVMTLYMFILAATFGWLYHKDFSIIKYLLNKKNIEQKIPIEDV